VTLLQIPLLIRENYLGYTWEIVLYTQPP